MIKIDVDKIRERTIKKMEEEGMSLNATAKEMGLVQPVLFRFVNGETIPNIDNLNKIFNYIYGA
jgi:predicted transcriptional regulator